MKMLMLVVVFVTIVLQLCTLSHTSTTVSTGTGIGSRSDYELLQTFLLYNLHKDVRPFNHQTANQPTIVRVAMELITLSDIDELTGVVTTVANFHMTWVDERFVWPPSTYGGIDHIWVNPKDSWKPSLALANPTKKSSEIETGKSMIRYNFSGFASWTIGSLLETSCDIDVTHFPFDQQTCAINLMNAYISNEVVLLGSRNTVIMTNYGENGAWILKATSVEMGKLNSHRTLAISLHLERRSTFFIINIFAPVVTLVLMNSFVFILPADSGERTGFAVTCLLSVAV